MIYLILLSASATLLLLGSLISFAPPFEESFAVHLVQTPDKWDIIFLGNDTTGISIAKDTKTAKRILIDFLTQNRLPTFRTYGHIAYALMIIAAFSIVGLIRENTFKKERQRAEQSPPPYSSPAAGSESGEA